MTTSTPNTFQIPEWNISILASKLEKINKRADKIGQPHVGFKVVGTEMIVDPDCKDMIKAGEPDNRPRIALHTVEITGTAPRINGYRFVGTLDHVTLPGSVVVQTVPGETVPQHYFHADGHCDHCGKVRTRNETFVLLKESDQTHTVIGRQCVRDFIGYDAEQVASYLSRLHRDLDSIGQGEEWTGGRVQWQFDKLAVLVNTIAIIRSFGWASRKAAMEYGKDSTSDLVEVLMYPARNASQVERREWLKNQLSFRPEEDEAEALAALEWLEIQVASTEYMHNLQSINAAECVPGKLMGYWVSLISTYRKAVETSHANAATLKVSEWVANAGEKIESSITVAAIRYIDGIYGLTTMVRMLDALGRTLVWFATGRIEWQVGDALKIKATVKKVEEYNGWKQTVITRAKVLA